MIRHLLGLVWRRKRAWALILVELVISFLVVFAVATGAAHLWDNARQPLGFRWQGVWQVSIDVGQATDDEWTPEQAATFASLLREVSSLPEVEAVAGILTPPYYLGGSEGVWEVDGHDVRVQVNEVTDELAEVLDLDVVEGRWFEAADDARSWKPVVIDRDLAQALFGAEDPVGRPLLASEPDTRVVGVVREFREDGELSAPTNYLFRRVAVGSAETRPPRNLLLRLAAGTPATFEARLLARMQAAAPGWSFDARSLDQARRTSHRLSLAPLVAGGVIAFFLLAMVALGLSGVLWQNLVRRIHELGLRRATGARRRDLHRQVLIELMIVTTLGLLLGVALVVQLPVLEVFSFLRPGAFAAGLAAAVVLIAGIALACGLYPAVLAARIPPAEALRSE